MYVTLTKNDPNVIQKIKDSFPNAKIILVDNLGFDIYPFIKIIKRINALDYDLILKIHSKKKLKDRKKILKPLIWNKKTFKKAINMFIQNKQLGMLGHKILIIDGGSPEENELLLPILKKLNIPLFIYKNFIPGSMFFIRSCIIKKLQEINLQDKEFYYIHTPNIHYGTPAHALERIFGIVTEYEGYYIDDTKNKLLKFIHKLINIQNYKKHKIIKFFGIKIKLKRKKNLT